MVNELNKEASNEDGGLINDGFADSMEDLHLTCRGGFIDGIACGFAQEPANECQSSGMNHSIPDWRKKDRNPGNEDSLLKVYSASNTERDGSVTDET
jgi:hypothetical protein